MKYEEKFEAFNIIIQRPDRGLNPSNARCPYCLSKRYESLGTRSTLMTYNNHTWNERTCGECGENYVVENKGNNTWITGMDGSVLRGMPSCFENYIYDCNCGGKVHRHYTDKVTGEPVSSLRMSFYSGEVIKDYKTVYRCDSCKAEVETKQDNWHD